MSKYLIILISVLLIVSIIFGITYYDAFYKIEGWIADINDLAIEIFDLGGYISSENQFNFNLVDGALGVYVTDEGIVYDIARYFRENCIPLYISNGRDADKTYTVKVFPTPCSFDLYYNYTYVDYSGGILSIGNPVKWESDFIVHVDYAVRFSVTYRTVLDDGRIFSSTNTILSWYDQKEDRFNYLASDGTELVFSYGVQYEDEFKGTLFYDIITKVNLGDLTLLYPPPSAQPISQKFGKIDEKGRYYYSVSSLRTVGSYEYDFNNFID